LTSQESQGRINHKNSSGERAPSPSPFNDPLSPEDRIPYRRSENIQRDRGGYAAYTQSALLKVINPSSLNNTPIKMKPRADSQKRSSKLPQLF